MVDLGSQIPEGPYLQLDKLRDFLCNVGRYIYIEVDPLLTEEVRKEERRRREVSTTFEI